MRRIAVMLCVLAAGGATLVATAPADDTFEYKIEMYNAFGLVVDSDVRVAGVNAGSVTALDVNEDKRAVVTVELTGPLAELGEDTKCSSEPQSLIAEYFIDCKPKGPPLEDGGTIPASQVAQTVQPDLVQNTLREPYKRRLQLLINEFGTALAGNAENLNEAIRLGAPALQKLEQLLRILADQNEIITQLNVDSDKIFARLAQRREDVVRFIQEARDTAAASGAERDSLSRDFEILDDFLAELDPTLADLETLAREQTPLLTDLRAAAPGLNELALNMPPFNAATEVSLDSLGEAGVVGQRALTESKEEIDQLGDAGRLAPFTGEILADFLRDIDDPRRHVETDARAKRRCDNKTKPCYSTGRRGPTGYTGMEGLLNYLYYQAGSLNQYDKVGHLLHFSLYYIDSGPCGHFHTGREGLVDHDPSTPGYGLPSDDDPNELTTEFTGPNAIADCIAGLGPSAPGLTELRDGSLPQYHPSVCPRGTKPQLARELLCDSDPSTKRGTTAGTLEGPSAGPGLQQPGAGEEPDVPVVPGVPTPPIPDVPGVPEVPDLEVPDLPELGEGERLPRRLRERLRRDGRGSDRATEDLLDFLMAP